MQMSHVVALKALAQSFPHGKPDVPIDVAS